MKKQTSFYCMLIFIMNYNMLQSQCGITCPETFSYIVSECRAIDLDDFLGSPGCTIEAYDSSGNLLLKPMPVNKYTACRPVKVVFSNGGNRCTTTLTLNVLQIPTVTPVPIRSISIPNYEANRVPTPEVEECIGGKIEFDHSDEFIGICNQVPKVGRTWIVYDQCNNSNTAYQQFDLLGTIQCNIIGAGRLPIGVPSRIRSLFSPRQFRPFEVQWSVIGDGWSIQTDKLDPSAAIITPSQIPGEAIVNLDIFDRLGCTRHCERVFTSYFRGNNLERDITQNPIAVHYNQHVTTISLEDEIESGQIRVVDIIGNVMFNETITGFKSLDIEMQNWNTGIYFIEFTSTSGKQVKTIFKH